MQQLGTNIRRTPQMQMTPTQAAAFKAVDTQRRNTSYPYYSTVSFLMGRGGQAPGPYQWGLQRGEERRAFSYGKGELMTNAGAPTLSATPVDTNLVQAAETISGENVEIHGLAIMVKQSGLNIQDAVVPQALACLMSHCSVDLSLNGDQNRFHLGCLAQMPGAGGLSGAGKDTTGPTSLVGISNEQPFPNNGWPVRSNFFRLPEGLIWRNKGNADSQLNVIFRIEREITIYSGGTLTNNLNGVDVPADPVQQIQGYNYPEQIEVTLLVHLLGRVIGPRTRSA